MQESLEEVVVQAEELLRLPQSAMTIMQLAQAPDTSTERLIEAIAVDPTFVARLLRLANSSTYSRGGQVASIDRAVSLIGFQEIGQLAIVLAAAKEFDKLETELLKTSSFWSHSLTTAILARKQAELCRIRSDGIFVAALLHDLGLLVEFGLCGDGMQQALEISVFADDIPLLVAEEKILGFSHPEIGARLCEHWALPELVVQAARYHHAPAQAISHQKEIVVIAWANMLESLGVQADHDPELMERMNQTLAEACDILDLQMPLTDDLLLEAQTEAAEMLTLF